MPLNFVSISPSIPAKDAVLGIGISVDTIIEPLKSEEKDGSGEHPRDAIIYYSDNGDVSSPARGGSGQKGSKYGEGKIYTQWNFLPQWEIILDANYAIHVGLVDLKINLAKLLNIRVHIFYTLSVKRNL